MNKQVMAGGLIGLGVALAMLVGLGLGLGIPIGSLSGKSSNTIAQPTRLKATSRQTAASSSQATAQVQPSDGAVAQQPSSNQDTAQTPSNSGTSDSAPVTALW